MKTISEPDHLLSAAYAKVAWRVLPLLLVIYGLGYIDRTNVSYAQLAMKEKLGFTDAIYGLGAGIFFIGYVIFEIPSNLLLARLGARPVIAFSLAAWGIASSACAVVSSPLQFYIARFVVGTCEAGLFPGFILYLSYWFPARRRGQATALMLVSMVTASMISGPISGWILQAWDGDLGLSNWQWLFILEGLPSVLFSGIALLALPNRPDEASWLTAAEKDAVNRDLAAEESAKVQSDVSTMEALLDPKIYVLSFCLFTVLGGYYAVTFWLPTIIRSAGVTSMLDVGLYAVIPNAVAAVTMIVVGRRSDRVMERRWHFAVPLLLAAAGLAFAATQSPSLPLALAALSVALAGVMSAFPTFWTIPTAYLSGTSAVVGVAVINSLGAFAGFVSPYFIGLIKQATGSLTYAFLPFVGLMIAGALAMLYLVPADILAPRRTRA